MDFTEWMRLVNGHVVYLRGKSAYSLGLYPWRSWHRLDFTPCEAAEMAVNGASRLHGF